jgi:hypothetical protein
MINALLASAPATDDQLAVQLLVELLLPVLPCQNGLVWGDIGLMRLPMADRSKPGQVRRQHCRGMICSRANWQIGEDGDSIVLADVAPRT